MSQYASVNELLGNWGVLTAKNVTFPDATHWLQHEEPARVSQILIDFFL